jgi:RimJ/RimL family protein N-acetyltransferase
VTGTLPGSLTLESDRLRLRRFEPGDAVDLRALADHPEVAATTLNLAYPYTLADAQAFIRGVRTAWSGGRSLVFAIERKADSKLIGAVGLTLQPNFDRAELGYWLGRAHWGRGYATEAARAVVDVGFERLNLNRIFAACFAGNSASERVMQKLGMTYEGTLRQHYKRYDRYHDGRCYGLLRSEWQAEPNSERTSVRGDG